MDWAALIEGVFTQPSPAVVILGSSNMLNAPIMTPQLSFGIYWIQGKLQCNNTHFSLLAKMRQLLFAYKCHPPPIPINELKGSGSYHVLAVSLGWISRRWLSISQLLGSSCMLIHGSWLLFPLVLTRVLWYHDHWRWGCCHWFNTWWYKAWWQLSCHNRVRDKENV